MIVNIVIKSKVLINLLSINCLSIDHYNMSSISHAIYTVTQNYASFM